MKIKKMKSALCILVICALVSTLLFKENLYAEPMNAVQQEIEKEYAGKIASSILVPQLSAENVRIVVFDRETYEEENLEFENSEDQVNEVLAEVFSEDDGNYVIEDFPAGNYRLEFYSDETEFDLIVEFQERKEEPEVVRQTAEENSGEPNEVEEEIAPGEDDIAEVTEDSISEAEELVPVISALSELQSDEVGAAVEENVSVSWGQWMARLVSGNNWTL